MKSLIGVYNNHEQAIEAVKLLQGEDFPAENISLVGKTHVEHHKGKKHIDEEEPAMETPLVVGAIAGPILGVLTGIGVFAIPGLGFIYGAGAVLGALAGFDFGLVGGGIASLLATIGVGEMHHVKYKEFLKKGKVILIAEGDEDQIKMAHDILQDFNEHHDIAIHKD